MNSANKDDINHELTYYLRLLDRCWTASQHYKEDLNKVLIWQGSLFVGILAITGLFGASKSTSVIFSFTLLHTILLHCIFAISWFFYLHKKLRAEMYIQMGIETEKYIKENLISNNPHLFNSFFDIESYYYSQNNVFNLTTSKGATLLILLLYICLVSFPLFSIRLSPQDISINYETLFTFTIFAIIVYLGHFLYKREEKQVMKSITSESGNERSTLEIAIMSDAD